MRGSTSRAKSEYDAILPSCVRVAVRRWAAEPRGQRPPPPGRPFPRAPRKCAAPETRPARLGRPRLTRGSASTRADPPPVGTSSYSQATTVHRSTRTQRAALTRRSTSLPRRPAWSTGSTLARARRAHQTQSLETPANANPQTSTCAHAHRHRLAHAHKRAPSRMSRAVLPTARPRRRGTPKTRQSHRGRTPSGPRSTR